MIDPIGRPFSVFQLKSYFDPKHSLNSVKKEVEIDSYGVTIIDQILYYIWSYKSSYSSNYIKNGGNQV